ncbi:MAG TPA: hypothetical protein ENK88_06890 [Campylobacterales bacterium]|nr:hypothetical protein [Campylobacterales bacterium]HHC11030.1 hypothetical protein [Campylobacterales bacterium]
MKYFWILVLILTVLVLFFSPKNNNPKIIQSNIKLIKVDDINKSKIDKKVSNIEQKSSKKMTKIVIDKEPINLFEELDIDRLKEEIPTKKSIKPILAIKIPPNYIKNLNKGDKVILPYIDEIEYQAEIIKKKTHHNGSVSVTGKLLDTQERCSIVLSEGDKYSFGTINLPNRSLELELIKGKGYIYSVDDIDNRWIDYNKKDTILPSSL